MKVAVNSVIQWDDGNTERVLWIDNTRGNCAVISLDETSFPILRSVDEIENAFNEGTAVKRSTDPYSYVNMLGEQYIAKHQVKRDQAWERIKDLVTREPDIFNEKLRNQMFTVAAEKFKCSKVTLYRDVKRYWKRGKTKNALLPHYYQSGGPGKERIISDELKEKNPNVGKQKRGRPRDSGKVGVNVDENTRILLQKGYRKYYASGDVKKLIRAYYKTLHEFFNLGYRYVNGVKEPIMPDKSEIPSLTQFKYWGPKGVDRQQVIKNRTGRRKFALENRPKLGTSTTMAKGPGDVYQIDSTIAPLYLVHRTRRSEIVGKPTVYFVMDVFSRRCIGLHVSLHRASGEQLRLVLYSTFTDKRDFCSRYGIEISAQDWDSGYIPASIQTDRAEYTSKVLDAIGDQLGFVASLTAPFRGDLKGIVEHKMHQFLEEFENIPGAVKKGVRERGEEMPGVHATLDIEQFTQILIDIVLTYNHSHVMEGYDMDEDMIEAGVKPIPEEIWNWGVRHKGMFFHERTIDDVRNALLPQTYASVNRDGIAYDKFHYHSSTGDDEGWFVKDSARRSVRKVRLAVGHTTDEVFVVHGRGEFERCTLSEKYRAFQGWTWEEVKNFRKEASKRLESSKSKEFQSIASRDARIAAVVERAKQDTTQALQERPQSKSARHKQIKINYGKAKQEEAVQQRDVLKLPERSGQSHVSQSSHVTDVRQDKKTRLLDNMKGWSKS